MPNKIGIKSNEFLEIYIKVVADLKINDKNDLKALKINKILKEIKEQEEIKKQEKDIGFNR